MERMVLSNFLRLVSTNKFKICYHFSCVSKMLPLFVVHCIVFIFILLNVPAIFGIIGCTYPAGLHGGVVVSNVASQQDVYWF